MSSRSLLLPSGINLRALVWEAADGIDPPFLLVHGLASNCRTWEAVGSELNSRGHRVAAVDLRGHGHSDKPKGGYDLATLADDVEQLIEVLGFEKPVVVGQSTGGNVAVDLAARKGYLLAGVAGVDGGSIELVDRWPVWEECRDVLAPPNLAGTPARRLESWLREAHPHWSTWAIGATMANFDVTGDGTVRPWLTIDRHLSILRSLWEHRPSALFAGLSAPLMLVFADTGDSWAETKRSEASRAAVLAPRVRVEWFSPADHDLHVERPIDVAGLLVSFGLAASRQRRDAS